MLHKICLICKSSFVVGKYRDETAKYCSRSCYVSFQREDKDIDHVCKHCGKHFRDSPCRKRIYCSKSCVNKSEKSIFRPKYSTVRKMMMRRNLIQQCEICSYDAVPDILGIHHKNEDRHNNSLENLMVVCPNCHSLIHHKHICH